MRIRFAKMQGLGNDFVVIDAVRQAIALSPQQTSYLADRHFGVGCDQLLLVEAARQAGADFRYRIFNPDGSEVEQCGNGARCFMRFVEEQGLTTERQLRVETLGGIIELRLQDDGQVTVNMGAPRFSPAEIPFVSDSSAPLQTLELEVDGQRRRLEISALSMGNPHAVQAVDDLERAPVALYGPLIETHPRFPQRVNAGFMQLRDRHNISLRVYERGAGETLACGSGACAAVVAGVRRGLLDSPVRVQMRGGELLIAWAGDGAPVLMTGPALTVFTGEIDLPERN